MSITWEPDFSDISPSQNQKDNYGASLNTKKAHTDGPISFSKWCYWLVIPELFLHSQTCLNWSNKNTWSKTVVSMDIYNTWKMSMYQIVCEILKFKKSCKLIGWEHFFNCNSVHTRLNSHYKAWSYKKKKHKRIKARRKPL